MNRYPHIFTAGKVRRLMNSFANLGKPFLFGVDYTLDRGFFLDNPLIQEDILWEIKGKGNLPQITNHVGKSPQMKVVESLPADRYDTMFTTLRKGLMRGDSFLANLTARTPVECDLSLREVFLAAKAPYKLLIGDQFVCFSPETFVRIEGDHIFTCPMKGTADATLPEEPESLMEDYKEQCEHATIVDLMRNDLNRVSSEVTVTRYRYLEKVETAKGAIYQTSSEIRGTLTAQARMNLGDTIFSLLPAGSISGAPKKATLELIARSETAPRGWYSGVFGLFDGESLDSAVLIRCLQRGDDGRLYFHSGGGVTVNSDCRQEYDELLTKIYLTR